ncbi:MAG: 2-oxoacid:ferredoxin oxidoreductase subunit beta [Alphaproteobacteria bacterium]|jgi:2-oxoglutarate/2-oxoacid ferredoxin oxidoreductase subunit beta|nr:2-oxoacid:ferredoxin oxidoreductase subunit beta [Alphaproteobacteria bacterium]
MARALEKYLRKEVAGTPFCPGCGHGILLGLILRAIEGLKLDMQEMLFVSGIGCAAWIPSPNFKADTLHTLHGRAVAFATGAKLANPKLKVMVISGDGDLASIGGNHLIHAARRNIDLTVICANNMIYGMTGGQAAPTTPKDSKTATTIQGNPYPPFDLCRLVKAAGADYVARGAVVRPYDLIEYISRAVETPSFSFVEALSPCPTQYGRRNQQDTAAEMFDHLGRACTSGTKIDASQPIDIESVRLGELDDR